MNPAAIHLDRLTKYHGPVVGIEDVSLDVQTGETFGFLGSNGAGKTTTIRVLLDLLRPTQGHASVLGFDCQRQGLEVRRRVGYLPGDMPIYPELTGAAYLQLLASLGPPPPPTRIAALLRRFNVSELDLSRRMRDYSQGMRRKLGVVQALMTDAPVLILDEPTSGLDPLMIEAFAETLDELRRRGATAVFLSSHVLSEVDRVCDRIALIRNGRLVAVRTLQELRAAAPRQVTITFSHAMNGIVPALGGGTFVQREPLRWVIETRGPIGALLNELGSLPVHDLSVDPLTIEELVLRLYEEPASC